MLPEGNVPTIACRYDNTTVVIKALIATVMGSDSLRAALPPSIGFPSAASVA